MLWVLLVTADPLRGDIAESHPRGEQLPDEWCEPCSWQERKERAVTIVGWDFTPVCLFHANHSVYEKRTDG